MAKIVGCELFNEQEDTYVISILKVNKVEYNGKKFNAYKSVDKNGKLIDVKFTQDCEKIPTEPCKIFVYGKDFNVDRNRQYPCVWVKNILRVLPFEIPKGEMF